MTVRRGAALLTDEPDTVRTGGQALVRCSGLARTYGSGPSAVVAVHDASCEIEAGTQIAVTGRSGSGKSTLLHLLAGLERPTAGTIEWPGLDGSPAGRPSVVGMVFQGPSLLPALDVIENVALPLSLAGVADDQAQTRARAALHTLGLNVVARKLPQELSGGQAQRVAVARALVCRPALILADEPTGQLDHESGSLVISVLISAAHELGAALVISTHDAAVADRLPVCWTVRDGRLDTGQDRS